MADPIAGVAALSVRDGSLISVGELKAAMSAAAPRGSDLHIVWRARDPDDGFTLVPYIRGGTAAATA